MINTYTYGNETWVDLDQGTTEEIAGLVDKYRIHPLVARELTSVTRKPRIELHNAYIYCILHFPAWKHTHGKENNQEVDFIIGKDILLTARYDTIDALHKFAKTLEVKEILQKERQQEKKPLGSQKFVFIALLRELYVGITEELASIEDDTDDIVSRMFSGHERHMVVAISEVTRTLLDFKKVTDLHRDVLESLHHYGKKLLGDEFAHEMEMILLDYFKINLNIQSSLEMLRELRETNNSLLTTKQNETVRELTVMGFIILPLTLLASIFGMSIHYLPFINNSHGFLIIMVIMLVSVIVTLAYAQYKKWL